jgi:hypothetical protein
MKNISNFYSLKWIKTIFIFMTILTFSFCFFCLIVFQWIYDEMILSSDLNIGIFQSTIWMSNIVSSLISMRYVFKLNSSENKLNYNYFKPNITNYFDTLRDNCFIWHKNIITNFGDIEKNIIKMYDNYDIFWEEINVSYPSFSSISYDKETFPLSLSQVLSENNQLLKNVYFSINTLNNNISQINNQTIKEINYNNITQINNQSIKEINYNKSLLEKNLLKIQYSSYLSIENSINNLLPKMFNLLRNVTSKFKDNNLGQTNIIIIMIISYGLTMIILCLFYTIFLFLTNKNMQEGFEKVCRIKIDKIDETMKRIEQFNDKLLSKFRQNENKTNLQVAKEKISENSKIKSQKEKYLNFSEAGKYKSLNILSYSYLQIIGILILFCVFLIPLYYISYSMIIDTNKILSVQNYIFGKSLFASASTVSIKCMISKCQTEKDLNYYIDFVDRSQFENVIRDIGSFAELKNFYNNKFLLNACSVIYNVNQTIEYDKCMNDTIIQSANNTDSLLKLIEETVSIIIKDKEMKQGKLYLSNGKNIPFTNELLFETQYFRDLEYVFYNYITPISDSFTNVVSDSLKVFLNQRKTIMIILIFIFGFIILLFSSYIIFFYINKLIHLLSVSRCILRILPTIVINNTAELETWIENKY